MAVRKTTPKETAVPDEQSAEETEAKAEDSQGKQNTTTTKKTPIPDGFLSPVDYAKHLSELRGEEVRPQIVYGYIKNSKNFPFQEREGFPRFIVNTAEADKFLQEKQEAKAKREADKKAKAEAEAAAKQKAEQEAAEKAAANA